MSEDGPMPSGRHLTEQDEVAIQRLAALRDSDGEWKWSIQALASLLEYDRKTVREAIRRGNLAWIERHDRGC